MQNTRLLVAWVAGLGTLALAFHMGLAYQRDFGPVWYVGPALEAGQAIFALAVLGLFTLLSLGAVVMAAHQHGRGEEARRRQAGESSSF